MATIRRRTSRTGTFLYFYVDAIIAGKRQRVKAKSKKEAEQLKADLDRQKVAVKLGVVKSPGSVSIRAVVSRYIAHVEQHRSKATAANYASRISVFLEFCDERGYHAFFQIAPDIVGQFKEWRIERGRVYRRNGERASEKRVKDVCNRSINHNITVLRSMCSWAVKQRMLAENPFKEFETLPVPKGFPSFFNTEEVGAILSNAGDDMRPLIRFLLLTGCRRSEAFFLEWPDIDLSARRVDIRAKTCADGQQYKPKTSNRSVPLHADLVAMLADMMPRDPVGFVFRRADGKQWTRNAQDRFKALLKSLGLAGGFHKLRHTAASRLVMAGVDLASVGEILGHRAVATTMLYSHLSPRHLTAQIDKLPGC